MIFSDTNPEKIINEYEAKIKEIEQDVYYSYERNKDKFYKKKTEFAKNLKQFNVQDLAKNSHDYRLTRSLEELCDDCFSKDSFLLSGLGIILNKLIRLYKIIISNSVNIKTKNCEMLLDIEKFHKKFQIESKYIGEADLNTFMHIYEDVNNTTDKKIYLKKKLLTDILISANKIELCIFFNRIVEDKYITHKEELYRQNHEVYEKAEKALSENDFFALNDCLLSIRIKDADVVENRNITYKNIKHYQNLRRLFFKSKSKGVNVEFSNLIEELLLNNLENRTKDSDRIVSEIYQIIPEIYLTSLPDKYETEQDYIEITGVALPLSQIILSINNNSYEELTAPNGLFEFKHIELKEGVNSYSLSYKDVLSKREITQTVIKENLELYDPITGKLVKDISIENRRKCSNCHTIYSIDSLTEMKNVCCECKGKCFFKHTDDEYYIKRKKRINLVKALYNKAKKSLGVH